MRSKVHDIRPSRSCLIRALSAKEVECEELKKLRLEDMLAFEGAQMRRDEDNIKLRAECEALRVERDKWKERAADRDHEAEQWAKKKWAAEAKLARVEKAYADLDATTSWKEGQF